jgi:hypothetical protein
LISGAVLNWKFPSPDYRDIDINFKFAALCDDDHIACFVFEALPTVRDPRSDFHAHNDYRNAKSPAACETGLAIDRWRRKSAAGTRADHEAVEGVFGDLPPQILI